MAAEESRARRLIPWLALACHGVREVAGTSQGEIARLEGLAPSGITRFEQGRNWPKDPERIVKAYAVATGYDDSRSLWAIAIGLWKRYGDDPQMEGAVRPPDLAAALDEYLERKLAAELGEPPDSRAQGDSKAA